MPPLFPIPIGGLRQERPEQLGAASSILGGLTASSDLTAGQLGFGDIEEVYSEDRCG